MTTYRQQETRLSWRLTRMFVHQRRCLGRWPACSFDRKSVGVAEIRKKKVRWKGGEAFFFPFFHSSPITQQDGDTRQHPVQLQELGFTG